MSRRHLMLQVSGDALFLEDLRSANGVFVNGERVRRPRRLVDGDRILLGTEELVVASSTVDVASRHADPFLQEPRTLDPEASSDVHDVVPTHARGVPALRPSSPGVPTEKAEAFSMLGKLADRLLLDARPDRAVRVLSDLLREVLDAARTGLDVEDDTFGKARDYAIKLARSTGDGRWIDYVIELHLALKQPLAADVVQQVSEALAKGVDIDLALLARYQAQVRELLVIAKPAERALCDLTLLIAPPQR